MPRKKKIKFKLDPEWLFKEPVDFEYNKYTLLGYLKKCEKNFDSFKIYPDFIELSLHLANLQSLMKENTMLLTNKKFETCDDEILMKELFPKKPPKLSKEEQSEITKTVNYSSTKLLDAFNFAKSIWSIAHDNVIVSLKKNRDYIIGGQGVIVYNRKELNRTMVWEYDVVRLSEDQNTKLILNLIFDESIENVTLTSILETKSRWTEVDTIKKVPVFEVKTNQDFPFEETLIPIIKRKVITYIFQAVAAYREKNV